jgi:1-acyl-sn-glycerol-3-phosphate acyltransferase
MFGGGVQEPHVQKTWIYRGVEKTFRFLLDYHQYSVHGFENIPATGPAVLAGNHTVAMYDSFLIAVPILDRLQRHVYGLADHLIFKLPAIGRIFRETGFVPGTRDAAIDFIKRGNLVGCMPGGMREAVMRGPGEKYKVDWSGRRGFVWVAMKSGAPIILTASPCGDDIYDVTPTRWTRWALEELHLPLALITGRGGTPIPKPVRLTQLVSEPMYADVAPDQVTEQDVAAMHERVCARMNQLMLDALVIHRALG